MSPHYTGLPWGLKHYIILFIIKDYQRTTAGQVISLHPIRILAPNRGFYYLPIRSVKMKYIVFPSGHFGQNQSNGNRGQAEKEEKGVAFFHQTQSLFMAHHLKIVYGYLVHLDNNFLQRVEGWPKPPQPKPHGHPLSPTSSSLSPHLPFGCSLFTSLKFDFDERFAIDGSYVIYQILGLLHFDDQRHIGWLIQKLIN